MKTKFRIVYVFFMAIIFFFFTACVNNENLDLNNNMIGYGVYVTNIDDFAVEEVMNFKLNSTDVNYSNVDTINSKVQTFMNSSFQDMKNSFINFYLQRLYSIPVLENYLSENVLYSNASISSEKTTFCCIRYKTIESYLVFHCKQELLHIEDTESVPNYTYEDKFFWTKQITYISNPFDEEAYSFARIFVNKFNANSLTSTISNVKYLFEYGLPNSRYYSNGTNEYTTSNLGGIKIHQWVMDSNLIINDCYVYSIYFTQYIWYVAFLFISIITILFLYVKNRKIFSRIKKLNKQ